MGVILRPPTLADEVDIRAKPAEQLRALPLHPLVVEAAREERIPFWSAWKRWHLVGVILLAAGLACIAYAGVRIVVDQRMAALYREPVPAAGWRILAGGLLALMSGAAILVMIERRR